MGPFHQLDRGKVPDAHLQASMRHIYTIPVKRLPRSCEEHMLIGKPLTRR